MKPFEQATPNLQRIMEIAMQIAQDKGEEYLSSKHVLLAMIRAENPAQDLFIQGGVTYAQIEAYFYPVAQESAKLPIDNPI